MSIKLDRLGHIFTEEISKIISEEVKDEDINFVTITAVDISSDLSYAKVYFTNLIDKDREKVTKALNKASGFIRGKLFDRVEIRKMPELTFIYDESIEYGKKIEKIIDNINGEDR
ncbi:MAG: 30S ribosome-binding factor RbfA [Bacilli bacterium]